MTITIALSSHIQAQGEFVSRTGNRVTIRDGQRLLTGRLITSEARLAAMTAPAVATVAEAVPA